MVANSIWMSAKATSCSSMIASISSASLVSNLVMFALLLARWTTTRVSMIAANYSPLSSDSPDLWITFSTARSTFASLS